jgi:hypothetical protein
VTNSKKLEGRRQGKEINSHRWTQSANLIQSIGKITKNPKELVITRQNFSLLSSDCTGKIADTLI